MHLEAVEQERVAARVAALEARTGTQVVTAVVGKSDAYPEAPWRAFALGAAAAALVSALGALFSSQWQSGESALNHAVVILGSGAVLALLTVALSPLARLFTDRLRRDFEVTQFAQSLFFSRGLDRTRGRIGILLLISLFERKVVLLPDGGFEGHVHAGEWQAIADRITVLMSRRNVSFALHAGLEGLEALLLERGFSTAGTTADELPNDVLQLRGER